MADHTDTRRAAALVTVPTLVLLFLFVVPIVAMLVFGFREGTFGPSRDVFTLEHFRDFLADRDVQRLLWRSTQIALAVTVAAVVFSYPVAYYLAFTAGRKRLVLMVIMLLPAMTSYLIRVLAWKVILGPDGPLNSVMQTLGITDEALPNLLYNRTAVVATLVYVWIPFAALPLFASLSQIPRSLHEAAADLGSGRVTTFLRVTLPLSVTGIVAAAVFVFIPTLGEWVTPMLIGGSKGVMYGNIIQDKFVRALNWPVGAVMSIAMMLLMVVVVGLPYAVWKLRARRVRPS
jgi:spermidine/putrescine transport system permease protein